MEDRPPTCHDSSGKLSSTNVVPMRLGLIVTVSILTALVAFLARPIRHEVDGLSMAPALRPGDVVSSGWLPQAGRLFRPRRFDRWLFASPEGHPLLKRVVGLPGETVSLRDGDLAIDGAVVLTPPPVLAELASPVAICERGEGPWQRSFVPRVVYDDADFAPEESRRLLAVRDVGLTTVIDTTHVPALTASIRVGPRAVRWRLPAGRFALVAGRLDGHLVAAAWCLGDVPATHGRSALPPAPPAFWQIVEPWPTPSTVDDAAPSVAVSLATESGPLDTAAAERCFERCTAWRDILHRLPPDGTASWHVGPGEVFVLGDFPSASRDSRHWGPLRVRSLLHRAL